MTVALCGTKAVRAGWTMEGAAAWSLSWLRRDRRRSQSSVGRQGIRMRGEREASRDSRILLILVAEGWSLEAAQRKRASR